MNNVSFDCVAIDTNVFEHLFDPCANSSNHIDKLLLRLMSCYNTKLIVDCGNGTGRIRKEYSNRLDDRITQTDDTVLNRKQILDYFFKGNHWCYVCVRHNDAMMQKIKKPPICISGTDAIFVYVAFKKGKILITNDRNDIIDERSKGDGLRRKKLLKISKRAVKKNADILTSEEAVNIC